MSKKVEKEMLRQVIKEIKAFSKLPVEEQKLKLKEIIKG